MTCDKNFGTYFVDLYVSYMLLKVNAETRYQKM